MKTTIKTSLLALACAAFIGVSASSSEAATINAIGLAPAKSATLTLSGSEDFRIWKVHGGHHRHGRRHGFFGGHFGGFGAPLLLGLALSSRHSAPAAPVAPAWTFDGTRYVCYYVDGAGRPLCR